MIKPIKTVTAYETADGKTFQTFAQAQAWQARLEFVDWYRHGSELYDSDDVMPVTTVLEWLLDSRTAVLELLTAAGGNDAAQL